MGSVSHTVELVTGLVIGTAAAAALAAAVWLSFRRAGRTTSPDALRVVLSPAAVAERTEGEFTTMLRNGELTQEQYRILIASLAQDTASVGGSALLSRPAPSAGPDRQRAN